MAGLNTLNNRGQWPEYLIEIAAERFRHLRSGKRHAWLWPEYVVETAAEDLRYFKALTNGSLKYPRAYIFIY